MVKRIFAITLIFLFATAAWMILGATIFSRTYESDKAGESRVESLWGEAQAQTMPSASYVSDVSVRVSPKLPPAATTQTTNVAPTASPQAPVAQNVPADSGATAPVTVTLPLESSKIDVALSLEHRQKGLLWYPTYKVDFSGYYQFRNPDSKERLVTFDFPFPAQQAIYDDLVFTVNNQPVSLNNAGNAASSTLKIGANQAATLKVAYRSQGLNSWHYHFGNSVTQVRDFSLHLKTNFEEIDFPESTLSPSAKQETAGGWELSWDYKNLLSGYSIGLTMPEKLQPGPLAGRISLFAPVSLLFFFFLMFIITTLRGIELHPMNYFFLATAFFAFHLLLAYLVDHVSIHAAFAISSVVSIFLVVSYLRLVVGMKFAGREAALAQFVYLVAFSYAFFLKGFTGLAITIGSVVTLFIVMQVTGRIRWQDKFADTKETPPVPPPPPSFTTTP